MSKVMERSAVAKKGISKGTTRFVGETKMSKENKKALKLLKAYKGMFG